MAGSSFMQARNNRRLRKQARKMKLDTSEYDALNNSLQRQDINGQSMRDVRAAGIGYDQGQYEQSIGIQGGRRQFATLQGEAQQRGGEQSATAYMSRRDQLGDINMQQRMGVAQGLTGARLGLLGQKNALLGQAAQQTNQMWQGFADLGAAGIGLGAESAMSGQGGGYQPQAASSGLSYRPPSLPAAGSAGSVLSATPRLRMGNDPYANPISASTMGALDPFSAQPTTAYKGYGDGKHQRMNAFTPLNMFRDNNRY